MAKSPIDARIQTLIALSGEQPTPLPIGKHELEEIGLLAMSGAMLSVAQRQSILSVLDSLTGETPRVNFTEQDQDGVVNVEPIVAGITSTHLAAFSKFIIGVDRNDAIITDPRTSAFLELALSDAIRFKVQGRRIRGIALAAARIRTSTSKLELGAADLRAAINCCARDSAARRAQVEIAVALLSKMSTEQRDRYLDELRNYWLAEREPELKYALAMTIVHALTAPDFPSLAP